MLQSWFVKNAPPPPWPFVDALPHLVDLFVIWMPQPTSHETATGLGVNVVTGKWPLPTSARPEVIQLDELRDIRNVTYHAAEK